MSKDMQAHEHITAVKIDYDEARRVERRCCKRIERNGKVRGLSQEVERILLEPALNERLRWVELVVSMQCGTASAGGT